MCEKEAPATLLEETEGFCSYECASGGGYTAPKQTAKEPVPQKPATFDWCPKTKDHKHVNGPVRVVGQSWYGSVHAWNCIHCNYAFGDH